MNIVALLSHSFLLTNLWGKEKRLQGGSAAAGRRKTCRLVPSACQHVLCPPPTCSLEGACYT